MRTGLRVARFSAPLFIILAVSIPASAALASSDIGVEVQDVTDNRVTKGPYVGGLEVVVNLTGDELDGIDSARVVVTDAVDDKGNNLLLKDADPPDFSSRNMNMGQMTVSLANPPRTARSVKLSGNAELFIPAKDPNSVVSIANALAKFDVNLKSNALDAENLKIELVSHKAYEKTKSKGPTKEDIAEIRKRGKAAGASDEEIEEAIEFAKALNEMADDMSEGAVILAGKKADIDRILRARLLRNDGSEISIPSRSWSNNGDNAVMILDQSEPPPADTTLELTILTKKATVSVPFALSGIELP